MTFAERLQPARLRSSPLSIRGAQPLYGALVLLICPLLVSAGVLLFDVGSKFHALDDNALNELQTRDVGRHLVLLGPYSRSGWNHLGPAIYYVLAVPYRLTGSHSVGLYVGALMINSIAVAGILMISWRRGGLPILILSALGLSAVLHNLGPSFLRDPWNPYVTVLPFGLMLFLTWELATGAVWALPVSAGVATFLVQTHVGYIPLALPLLIGGAVSLVITTRRLRGRSDGARCLLRASAISVAVLGVMWLPPVLAVVLNRPGNLGDAAYYFIHTNSHHSLTDGYRVVAAQLSLRPEWITGAHTPSKISLEPTALRSNPLPWLILLFAAASLFLWRRRIGEGTHLAVVVAATLALGILSVARTSGPIYAYRLRWTWMLAMAAFVVVAWAGWVLVAPVLLHRRRFVLAALLVGMIVGLSIANAAAAGQTSTPDDPAASVLAKLMPRVVSALPRGTGPVVVQPTFFDVYSQGAVLWLERTGINVRVGSALAGAQTFGVRRVYHGGPVRATLMVGSGGVFDVFAGNPRLQLIAYHGRVSPAQRVPIAARLVDLAAQYHAGRISTRDFLRTRAKLNHEIGDAVGFFIERKTRS